MLRVRDPSTNDDYVGRFLFKAKSDEAHLHSYLPIKIIKPSNLHTSMALDGSAACFELRVANVPQSASEETSVGSGCGGGLQSGGAADRCSAQKVRSEERTRGARSEARIKCNAVNCNGDVFSFRLIWMKN